MKEALLHPQDWESFPKMALALSEMQEESCFLLNSLRVCMSGLRSGGMLKLSKLLKLPYQETLGYHLPNSDKTPVANCIDLSLQTENCWNSTNS